MEKPLENIPHKSVQKGYPEDESFYWGWCEHKLANEDEDEEYSDDLAWLVMAIGITHPAVTHPAAVFIFGRSLRVSPLWTAVLDGSIQIRPSNYLGICRLVREPWKNCADNGIFTVSGLRSESSGWLPFVPLKEQAQELLFHNFKKIGIYFLYRQEYMCITCMLFLYRQEYILKRYTILL